MLLFYFWPFPIWEMKVKSSFYFVCHLDKPGCCIFIRRERRVSFLFATQCIVLHAFTHTADHPFLPLSAFFKSASKVQGLAISEASLSLFT